MDDAFYCPILRGDCKGTDCAWWDIPKDVCAVLAIAWEFERLGFILLDLADESTP